MHGRPRRCSALANRGPDGRQPDFGGVSGPELYTAWDRLKPAFVASYIADPVAWDPHTLMPGGDLNDAAVAKLANYLKAIVEEE